MNNSNSNIVDQKPLIGLEIVASIGKYWVQGFKTPYETLREAKEAIDFMMEETYYLQ